MANTLGEKELKTSYDELTSNDSTKFIGHEQNLKAEEGSLVPRRYKEGISGL